MLSRLRDDLKTALRARDKDAISALRSAVAAIENAEAPPIDQAGGAAVGAGASEGRPRTIDAAEMRAILAEEVRERSAAVTQYEGLGREDLAARLRAEIAVLRRHLDAEE